MRKILLFLIMQFTITVFAQIIPAERSVDWTLAGYRGSIPSYAKVIDITDFGGSGDGISINDEAFAGALKSLEGNAGVIYFPAGVYLFHKKWVLSDSIIIRGAGSVATTLKFDLSGRNENLITIQGKQTGLPAVVTQDAPKGSNYLVVNDASGFSAGDYIKLYQNDSSLVTSGWAYHTVGQVATVASVEGNKLLLASPLRKDYPGSVYPRVLKLKPVRNTGLECVGIERMDETSGQTKNVEVNMAAQCWIKGIASNKANYAHVAISTSSNIEVRDSYFHHAFGYGGGGQGYGVAVQLTSGECRIENNIFQHLRHAMLLQAGVNGNVFGYNYSSDPVRTEFPTNAAGDIVLHGNYVFANLFEGNICQTISIDNSHGINGPYNTFFRNSARLYGLLMSSTNASDSQNFVGNEIPNTGLFLGNYLVCGTGHLEYGNNVRGTVRPAGTENLTDFSYYRLQKSSLTGTGFSWPTIGAPYPFNTGTIPAELNYLSGNYTSCGSNAVLGNSEPAPLPGLKCFPNPATDKIFIEFDDHAFPEGISADLYNSVGHSCLHFKVASGEAIRLDGLADGIYILKAGGRSFRIVKAGK